MVARENLRFNAKDLVTSNKARFPSTSDRISLLSTSNCEFKGEVISKDKSFRRGSLPNEACLFSNGVKSSKGKNGNYCGVYQAKSQSMDSDAPKTKKSRKGKSKKSNKVNYKFKVMNNFKQDEDILRLAIKEVEFSKPMLQKNLTDLGAIQNTIKEMQHSCHDECFVELVNKVHQQIEEIHEDVRASTKNLQFKVEKMCMLKNKLAFLSHNIRSEFFAFFRRQILIPNMFWRLT